MVKYPAGNSKLLSICQNLGPIDENMLDMYQKNEKDVDFMRKYQNSIKDILDKDKNCMQKCKYCKQIVGMDCLELNLIERGRIT